VMTKGVKMHDKVFKKHRFGASKCVRLWVREVVVGFCVLFLFVYVHEVKRGRFSVVS
jgi:hypothetical protein